MAELSRLARGVYFTSKLLEKKGRFKACDIPHADEFIIDILAAVAQEAVRIFPRAQNVDWPLPHYPLKLSLAALLTCVRS